MGGHLIPPFLAVITNFKLLFFQVQIIFDFRFLGRVQILRVYVCI